MQKSYFDTDRSTKKVKVQTMSLEENSKLENIDDAKVAPQLTDKRGSWDKALSAIK